eukprot:scaffold5907_cov120-Isochrysis_galbana.AAC.4
MSALGTDRALKRRLDLFGMPASERGTPTPATVPDVRLPMQDRHGVAQAPVRLVRLIRCRIRGAANNRPITVTDVQSDGRPRDVPGDSRGAQHLRAAAAAKHEWERGGGVTG